MQQTDKNERTLRSRVNEIKYSLEHAFHQKDTLPNLSTIIDELIAIIQQYENLPTKKINVDFWIKNLDFIEKEIPQQKNYQKIKTKFKTFQKQKKTHVRNLRSPKYKKKQKKKKNAPESKRKRILLYHPSTKARSNDWKRLKGQR